MKPLLSPETGCRRQAAAETDLAIERQYRQTMEQEIESERRKLEDLEHAEDELHETKARYAELMGTHASLQVDYRQQEQALIDLGGMVSEDKLRITELEEVKRAEAKQTWATDNQVKNCRSCHRGFSLSRRRHHCRRCGQIFCNDCSSKKATLASSATSARVCNKCFVLIVPRPTQTTKPGEPVLLGGWADE
jgi:DNA repair exonuclease SbcCD ATPase subunit